MPAEHIPSGTTPWRTSDAQRWLATAPALWSHPLWALLALAGSAAWAVASAPLDACTTAAPCGTDWPGNAAFGLLALTLYWVWRQPRLALAGLAAVSALSLMDTAFTAELGETSTLVFLGATAFTAAGLVHRLSVAGRQRARALETAGPVARPLPAAARNFRRGGFSFFLAAVFLAVAGFGGWQVQQVVDTYEERAAAATPVSGQVTDQSRNDEDIDVLTVEADGRTHRFETAFPEDFPVGSQVDIVVDGDWTALVAEPYDAFGWEFLTLAGAVVGLAFFANGVDGLTRSKRLRRGPVPVLRVLVREDHEDARTWVFAADDLEGRQPVLHFHSLWAYEKEDDEAHEDHVDDEDDPVVGFRKAADILRGEDPPPPLREAVLYGALYAGAEVAFVARDDADDPEVGVQCSVTALKPAAPALPARWTRHHRARKSPQRPVDEITAGLTPTTSARTWKAHSFSRAVGLGLLVVQGGATWAALDDEPTWYWLVLAASLAWLVTTAATALTWRITADRDGLWVTGAWRVQRVPWDMITSVRHSEDRIRIGRTEDSAVELAPTGWAWMERRLGRAPHAVRAAEEVQALLLRPELRPLEEAPPGRQGMPVGPPLVALSVLLLL
ncbi:hypothetical protein H9Y04_26585 [Streptomyces sp. TRM66268-LWL]|uniref:PH domain-containing protein n=1 Tax=Streptomyces polyasparticus TaxID=2767826 RepID=A0ABR7SNG2_9ACTN|nr:hypothetical protein [Streptomyces polyasparticus]